MVCFENYIFHLQTVNTSYLIGILSEIPVHLYWGKRLSNVPQMHTILQNNAYNTFSAPDIKFGDSLLSTDNLTLEYPTFGSADLRTPAFHASYADGSSVSRFSFQSYCVCEGKYSIKGLPAVYSEQADRVQTLKLVFSDRVTGLQLTLVYGVFEEYDAITRSVIIENTGENDVRLEKVLSASVDFKSKEYDFIHLCGSWARECNPQRRPLFNGLQQIDSMHGASGHQHNPFFALAAKNTNENSGETFGFNLVYSGNFIAGVETDAYDISRAFIGINPSEFAYTLRPGESFYSPEAVLVYSDEGIGGMSRIYHRLFRTRLCRGSFRDNERYVLINNWEATGFDFDEKRILALADSASKIGIDLLVLDDGWFGKRNADNSSLGDWTVNSEKLPHGLSWLAEQIAGKGMKFGLWFEPEMVSPDSHLYCTHPDWCLHTPGRPCTESRNQLVLDLTRKDVCEYITDSVCKILDTVPISYVKWDMNRYITEAGSALLDSGRQGEVYHRYILGLYETLEYITSRYPDILFESCAGGGGRFDAGMLYYMPQIWTSDDTDAEERIMIQYGTSYCYPYSAMGAHVSCVPNYQVGRVTPFEMRCNVALPGQFGFELNLDRATAEEISLAASAVKRYRKLSIVFHQGDLYRLHTPEEGSFCANEFISQDGNTVVLCTAVFKAKPNDRYYYIKFRGLDPQADYIDENNKIISGEILMQVGIGLRCDREFESRISVFKRKQFTV